MMGSYSPQQTKKNDVLVETFLTVFPFEIRVELNPVIILVQLLVALNDFSHITGL